MLCVFEGHSGDLLTVVGSTDEHSVHYYHDIIPTVTIYHNIGNITQRYNRCYIILVIEEER